MSTRLELMGRLGTLAEVVDNIPVPDASSMLFGAGTVRVFAAAGRQDLAMQTAADITRQVLAKPSSTSHGVIGLVAEALSSHPDRDLRKQASEALAPFKGGAMVIGIGLRLLPSISYLCDLLGDSSRSGSEQALQACIETCDSSRFLVWSIHYRQKLAELTGSTDLLKEAAALAEETDLAQQL